MPASSTSSWPDYLSAQAKALYESGKHSMAQIAAAIGNGKSRNSVIGRARREGWVNPTPRKGGPKPGEKRPRASQPKLWRGYVTAPKLEQPEELPPSADFLGLTIWAIENGQCHYPAGDGPDFLFCGQPIEANSTSYCAFHDAVCHERPLKRSQFISSQRF